MTYESAKERACQATLAAWASSNQNNRLVAADTHTIAAMAHRAASKLARVENDRSAEDQHSSMARTHEIESKMIRNAAANEL